MLKSAAPRVKGPGARSPVQRLCRCWPWPRRTSSSPPAAPGPLDSHGHGGRHCWPRGLTGDPPNCGPAIQGGVQLFAGSPPRPTTTDSSPGRGPWRSFEARQLVVPARAVGSWLDGRCEVRRNCPSQLLGFLGVSGFPVTPVVHAGSQRDFRRTAEVIGSWRSGRRRGDGGRVRAPLCGCRGSLRPVGRGLVRPARHAGALGADSARPEMLAGS